MVSEDWVEKVKEYRLAVDAYCDAVDRIDSTGDLGQEWQQIEAARTLAEQARSALLKQRRKPLLAQLQSLVFDKERAFDEEHAEELVLGDLGQHGG